ncbi:sulfurtransferase TusA family protein [soil metagenome]
MISGDDAATTIDARGHRCPVPSLRLRRALAEATPGSRLVMLADDPMARIDVPHLCAQLAAEVVAVETGPDGSIRFTVCASAG